MDIREGYHHHIHACSFRTAQTKIYDIDFKATLTYPKQLQKALLQLFLLAVIDYRRSDTNLYLKNLK